MSKSVKTSNDWMSLFLGGRDEATAVGGGGGVHHHRRYGDLSSGGGRRYDDHSYSGSHVRRRSEQASDVEQHAAARYSPPAGSRYYPMADYSSPPEYRRSHSYSAYSTASSRYLPQYTSKWTAAIADPEPERRLENGPRDNNSRQIASQRSATGSRSSISQSCVTVLNEGAVLIRRPAANAHVDSSSEDDDQDEEESKDDGKMREREQPDPVPARDPLEVEEEELTARLQTAGLLLSLPEEETARRRLVEIRQMRENPDLFSAENSRGWQFNQLTAQLTPPPSQARAEEEKILLLRLSSRGISEVEVKDVLVRLQELWRDRRDLLALGLTRLEQEYEHHLNESSTEISELEGSVRGKMAAIARLQEELLVLSLRKERIAADMEKVTATQQEKVEEVKRELEDLDKKSSEYSIVKAALRKGEEESSLPEDERSELEAELECPVCLEISRPPIYQCGEGHIVCSACKPLLRCCCICEARYAEPPIRCRLAEKLAAKYFRGETD